MRFGHKISSTAILSLLLIQVGQFKLVADGCKRNWNIMNADVATSIITTAQKRAEIHLSKFTLRSHDEKYSDTYVYKRKYTFTLGQTQVYIYTRANLPRYVFAFICTRLHRCVKFSYM